MLHFNRVFQFSGSFKVSQAQIRKLKKADIYCADHMLSKNVFEINGITEPRPQFPRLTLCYYVKDVNMGYPTGLHAFFNQRYFILLRLFTF